MQYQWFVFWSGLFDWLIFSVSLFVIADKLGWQKKRDAWVPGLRIYRLGESIHMNKEGMFCGVMDLLFTAAILMKLVIKGGRIVIRLHCVLPAYLSEPRLICDFCPSDQRFAYSFFQIPPHDGHPCCSAIHFPLPGRVRDFHPLERAHGAHTKSPARKD